MVHKLSLKRIHNQSNYTQYPQYHFFIDNKCILIYNAPKKVIKFTYLRYKFALKHVPKGATVLPTLQDREPYNGKILGGWICEKRGFTYGIYLSSKDEILTNPKECIYWSLSKDEIDKFTNYEEIEKATKCKI